MHSPHSKNVPASWLCALALLVCAARAHEPMESSTVVRLQHGRLEMAVTMSAQMATVFSCESGEENVGEVSAITLPVYRARLLAKAAGLFDVVVNDAPLAPERTSVGMSKQGEPQFTVIYPQPASWPVRMRVRYLKELPAGYSGTIEVFDENEASLASRVLSRDGPGAEVAVNPTPAAPITIAPVAVAAPSAPARAQPVVVGGWSWPVAVVAMLLPALAFIFIVRRRLVPSVLLVLSVLSLAAHAQRQMEALGRGMVAMRKSSTQIYVGWRLLGNDPEGIAFNLYRSANGAAAVKLNASPLTTTTDYLDTPASLSTTAYSYFVKPVIGGVEQAASASTSLAANPPTRQYLSIPLQPIPPYPGDASDTAPYDVKFCWVGDLDGDGEYDFVVDRLSKDTVATHRQYLEGYKRDGTFLWRVNMGPNSLNQYTIEPGAAAISVGHSDHVTVFDMDGDGRAEVLLKTANGTILGDGSVVTAADNIIEYMSVLDGLTGAEKPNGRATIPNPFPGDGPLASHFGILYCDGQRPSVLFQGKNRKPDNSFQGLITTWDYRNGQISQRWSWVQGATHAPEGHQIRISDVDNDGKDEFCDIGFAIDDNGSLLFTLPEVTHGDRFHITDIDPDRPGLENYIIQQNNPSMLATALFNAGTGGIIKKWYSVGITDVGRGVMADIDPAFRGCEMFSTQGGIFDAKGNQIYADPPFPPEAIWWDADLQREFVGVPGATGESPVIDGFNPANSGTLSRIYTIYSEGVHQAYGGRPAFTGDILGDWREELILVTNDYSALRIYTTTLPATNRLYTLMHNPQYRAQTTCKGYVQSSYVDYYLGSGMSPPPPPPMVDAKLVWRGGAGATTWDAGVTSSWLNAGANSAFAAGDTVRFDIGGDATTTVNLVGTLQPGAVTVHSPKSYVFNGSGALAGAMKFTKAGAGALTLGGTHTFTGATTVWDGALLVNGDVQGSAVTVWGGTWGGAAAEGKTGGRIGGTGRFGQLVTLQSGAAIVPGAGMNSAGTTAFGAGITAASGSVFALDLSDDPTGVVKPNDRVAITGNLALSGTVNVVINALNAQLASGTYTLATYTGTLTGSLANLALKLPAGSPGTLALGGGALTLTVPTMRAPASIVWAGGVAGNAWDLATTQNWRRSGAADVFVTGDTALFDATGAANSAITLSTALPTAGVTVNAATDYTLAGSGSLGGAGGLVKSGAGTLTINTTNDFTGPVTISGGVLAVNNLNDGGVPSSIGASSTSASNFTINGGTLRLIGPQTNTNRNLTLGVADGTIDIPTAGNSLQMSGVISGVGGALTKTGAGVLILAGTNTYNGGTTISGGTVLLASSSANVNALGTGAVTLSNATLSMSDVQNNDVAAWNLIVPAATVNRLDCDGRCSLTGTLTGGGALTLYCGYVRTDLKGNWSAFTGNINVVADSDGGDFRITNTAGYPGTTLDLGDQVYAYYNSTPPSSGQTIDIGALSGVATSFLKGGPTAGRTVTYRIGGKNIDTTFAGTLANSTGPTAITKLGAGTWTLSGASTYTGATVVSAGVLKVTGSLTGTASLSIAANATLAVADGDVSVTGAITNTGTLRLTGAATLSSTGTFTNNGTLDIINAPQTLPANFVNNGTVLDASVVKVKAIALAAGNVNVTIQSYTGHNYQLQRKAALTDATWQNIGLPQVGATGTVLTFTNAAGTGGFYRVSVSP